MDTYIKATNLRLLSVDVELSNRCHIDCQFCPRDKVPHQGTMAPEVFGQVLVRLREMRDHCDEIDAVVDISFCGLGEELLHPRIAEHIRQAVDIGFGVSMCSNGLLLDERRAQAIAASGLRRLYVNCGEIGADYERVYGASFPLLVANVRRFLEVADGRCDLYIVLVDYLQDPDHVRGVREFWIDQGVEHFFASPMLNRSGSLHVEGWDFASLPTVDRAIDFFESHGVESACGAGVGFPFIGYDGHYYLCSSDWERRVDLGTVFDLPITALMDRKLRVAREREPICKACCHDPINKLALGYDRLDRGEITPRQLMELAIGLLRQGERLDRGMPAWRSTGHVLADDGRRYWADEDIRPDRRLIPVAAG